MPKVRSRVLESISDAKKATKQGAGGAITRIKDEGFNGRLMDEPDEGWVEYYEHYVESGPDKGYRPCVEGCMYCEDGDTPQKRFLVNAINLDDNNKVCALMLPKSVAASITKKYGLFHTVTDRDYTITREDGAGGYMEYDVTPGAPRAMNMSRYKRLDLQGILDTIVNGEDEEDDEDEETEAPRRVAKKAGPAKRTPAKPVRVAKKAAAPAEEPRRIAKKAAPAARVAKKPAGRPLRRA